MAFTTTEPKGNIVDFKAMMKDIKRREENPTWVEWIQYRVWYPLYRKWLWITELPAEIKWFIQRGRKGYSERDVWSLDYYIATWLPKALRELKRSGRKYGGTPTYFAYDLFGKKKHYKDLTEDQWKVADKAWMKTLDKMIEGFEAWNKLDEVRLDKNYDKKMKALEKKRTEGMSLFVKWFGGLWW
jgi:hypothetical protein